jgi:hypothetical protein
VTGRLIDIEAKLDRLLTFHGIDAGQRPDSVTHVDGGLFAPGSGWISDQPRTEDEELVTPESVVEFMAEARASLRPGRDE